MKRRIILSLVILMLFWCGRPANQADRPPDVLTSIFPVYDIIRNLSGNALNVQYVVPAGANPHEYEPTSSDIRNVRMAKYFIGVHPEFDGWVGSLVSSETQSVFLLETDHEGRHEVENPHVWLCPADVRRLVDQISIHLTEWIPEQKEEINQRSLDYKSRLDSLDQVIQHRFDRIGNRAFVQWHSAWDAFAKEYHLEIAGTLSQGHGDKPSVKAFKDLIELCKTRKIKTVVAGLNSEDKLAETLAREIGASVIRLDTIGNPNDPKRNSVLKLIDTNARLLAEALSSE